MKPEDNCVGLRFLVVCFGLGLVDICFGLRHLGGETLCLLV